MNRRQTLSMGLIVLGLLAFSLGSLRYLGNGDESAAAVERGTAPIFGKPVTIERGQSATFGGQQVTLESVSTAAEGGLQAKLVLGAHGKDPGGEKTVTILQDFETGAGTYTVTGLIQDRPVRESVELTFAAK